ncbi:glycosyltransferase [Moheibacter lacus]|uniref:Glycosyltransferase n=1 Tax=Moheibacter lacus TaxID=2745851 RepID=A0A838ZP87_9FLAO|nr:glycosyltransferase [Moheibacter lacus]MBA5629197.1 glycosyltransferase [Moheibacter lacus]
MKKALVHDWYYVNGGAEKVIRSINSMWDDFEHYALTDFLTNSDRDYILNGANVHTSFIQKLPTAKSNHRKFLQLFPYGIEQFDLSEFELVISSSSSIAKGVLTHQDQLHICYCHSPMRYAWDLYHDYLKSANLNKGLKGIYAKYVLNKIRAWDIISSNRVDHFVANSNYIAERIHKVYRRESEVIYPPVDVSFFEFQKEKDEFYFTASRMVPYKNTKQIVQAFNEIPNKKLVVAGDGPELEKIKKIAKPNIEFVGFISNDELKSYLKNAKAFVFAALEDFGIVPVEAQACGTPVICLGKGGTKETVINEKTGVHFKNPVSNEIKEAILYFESLSFDPELIRENVLKFSKNNFEKKFKSYVERKYQDFT